MSKRKGVANIGALKRRGEPLSGCERYLRGLKSAEEGRYIYPKKGGDVEKMKMKEIWAIGIIAMIVIGIGLTAAITDELSGRKVLPETSDELQELYCKYNITENDIKFAEGRLPHYLEGTILDGKVVSMGKITFDGNKVVVSEWV